MINLSPIKKPININIISIVQKNFNDLYIRNSLSLVGIDFFTYLNILLKSLEDLNSVFVFIGTEIIAILLILDYTIVSRVYVIHLLHLIS